MIGAHHYLGYGQGTGEQLKYLIFLEARPLAAMGFSAAAWRVACRDQFIGWDDQARQKNLPLVVNNHRFLILPWVKITNLASWILAHLTRRLRQDWQRVYAHDLALVETVVEKNRFHGTCYRAANWFEIGETAGVAAMIDATTISCRSNRFIFIRWISIFVHAAKLYEKHLAQKTFQLNAPPLRAMRPVTRRGQTPARGKPSSQSPAKAGLSTAPD